MNNITTEKMTIAYINEVMDLWKNQFKHFHYGNAIYPFWIDKEKEIKEYFNKTISDRNAFVAIQNNVIAGFITCDIFDFHGVNSAICHFCGNASIIENRTIIYLELYKALSEHCVFKGVLCHYISISENDTEIRNMLFDLGFGAYGSDAFTDLRNVNCDAVYPVNLASKSDAKEVLNLYNESVLYFKESPIYLDLGPCMIGRIEEKIDFGNIYIARDKEQIIGFFEVEKAENDNLYRMYTKGCCLVCSEIGTFIKEDYRGKGIGSAFINVAKEFCVRNSLSCAHVPWENFNPYANRFWRKYFNTAIIGMKKNIHPDILQINMH